MTLALGLAKLSRSPQGARRRVIMVAVAGPNRVAPARRMQVLVFAHTPPPHHGQSLMVQLMLEGFQARPAAPTDSAAFPAPACGPASGPLTCLHVNARLSSGLTDVGRMRLGKLIPLLRYCVQALHHRWRQHPDVFYYVPSPPKRSALYRDWVVMLLCRPWFPRLVLHWHAVGLGAWLTETARPWERWLTHRLLDRADLALVLSEYNRADAERLHPRAVAVVPNGIPDPCPDYATTLAPVRTSRAAARGAFPGRATHLAADRAQSRACPEPGPGEDRTVRVLFLAHCTRDKGLFDTIAGVERANAALQTGHSPFRMHLTVAGSFLDEAERAEFAALTHRGDHQSWLTHVGFVSGDAKTALFRQADLFCFPTYYANEGLPVNLLEAMAYGLPVVTTRWRAIPELFPPGHPGLVDPRDPEAVARGLLAVWGDDGRAARDRYLAHYTLDRHLATLAAALTSPPAPASSR